jgi:hypothetical protein
MDLLVLRFVKCDILNGPNLDLHIFPTSFIDSGDNYVTLV